MTLLLMAATPALARRALSFRLDDQFERHHDAVSLFKAGRPLVFIGGSQRATREALAKWLGPLRKALGKDARIVGYLDLRGVPFFVPNCLIRRSLKKAFPRLIVLCDFKGRATNSLGFSPKATLEIRVFDAQGRPRGAVKGPFTVSRLAQVSALVKGKRTAGH